MLNYLSMITRIALVLALCLSLASAADLRTQARETLKKAAEFCRQRVSTEGGYHFRYAADLSYGRSEQAEGLTQVSVQREGTPSVGMAFLEAWEATGDQYYAAAGKDHQLAHLCPQRGGAGAVHPGIGPARRWSSVYCGGEPGSEMEMPAKWTPDKKRTAAVRGATETRRKNHASRESNCRGANH